MNHYTFEEINIEQEINFDYIITEEKMNLFFQITNDSNPLHRDLNFAKEKGYEEKVVYGMLSASILSTLAGVYMPGEHSLIHSIEINFLKPVFVSNCPLKINGKVIAKDDRFSQITVKYSFIDQNNEKVCRGVMKIGVTK